MIITFKRKSLSWSIIGISIVVLLAGCASDSKSNVSTEQPVTQQQENVNTDSKKPSKDVSAQGNTGRTTPVKEENGELIKEIYELSKEGKVPGVDFVSGQDLIDKVHASWGEPDKPVGAGDPYEAYSPGAGRGSFAFGIGRGEVIYDVRSYGSSEGPKVQFSQISLEDITQTLGVPSENRTNGNDDILVYKVGEYELKFVGPHDKQVLHHISVYSPKAAAPMGGK
ncbi:YjgB family protein [Paenibacillus antarcticus]|uniref:DUF4309 domain-containing protein n=1 Tax=Paenibacillus antarcticus TaxID=253703 RepID=A0A168Q276_9BACL|nr:YjgB family protein [Paenibacillus antarcticus]OAB47309.1 hypothetical protein PBAT_06285 [Paenibacillus antarcticus]